MNQDIKALCPRPSLDGEFLRYFLLSQETNILELVTRGATVHRLATDCLKNLAVPLPTLPEQKRIVAILDEVFEGIDRAAANAEKNLANARELFESYLNAVFTEKGEGWMERPLHEMIDIKHGFAFQSTYFADEGDYVLLTPGNFYEEGGYRDRGHKQKYYVGEIPDGYILDEDDFLIAMTEQAAGLLGSSIIVPEDGKFLHNQRLGLARPKDGVPWCNGFFFHAFNTMSFRRIVHNEASGVKVRHTSPNQKLGRIVVAYPPSSGEQGLIARRLDSVLCESKRLRSSFERKLNDLAELEQSILRKAFSGELTARPDRVLAEAGA